MGQTAATARLRGASRLAIRRRIRRGRGCRLRRVLLNVQLEAAAAQLGDEEELLELVPTDER